MAESDHYDYLSSYPNGDAFGLNTRCIVAIGESIQSIPAIKKLLGELIDGIVHPDGDNARIHAGALDRIRQWIWDCRPTVTVTVPDILIIFLLALDNTVDE